MVFFLLQPLLAQNNKSKAFRLQDSLIKKAITLRTSRPNEAVALAKNALVISKTLKDPTVTGYNTHVLGVSSIDSNKPETGMAHLIEALHIYDSIGDLKKMSGVYNSIGYLYNTIDVHENAIEAYTASLKIAETFNDKRYHAVIFNNLGESYLKLDSLERAMKYLKKSYALNTVLGDSIAAAQNLGNIGLVHFDRGNYQRALTIFADCRVQFQKFGQLASMAEAELYLAKAHSRMGKFSEAMAGYNKADSVAKKLSAFKISHQIYLEKASLFEKKSQPDSALLYYKRVQEIEGKLPSKQSLANIQAINTIYKNGQVQKVLKKRTTIFKTGFLVYVVVTLVLLSLGLLYFKKLRKQQLQEKTKNNNLLLLVGNTNKKLTTTNLKLVEKNSQLATIRKELLALDRQKKPKKQQIKKVSQLVNTSLKNTKNWEAFQLIFEQTNDHFIKRLTETYSEIGPAELKLASLIKIGFSTKDISNILNLNENSVKTARWRLRKKLRLERKQNLESFLTRFP
ncbi:tetratricopeptide repeat protein [Maribacter sp. 2-571]|uniref:tetratricopeptide repeat protein n=1 Tax=Maribacter sp. 2-571 TaxID=3417569 RepID=UPI003D34E4A2